MKYFTLETSKKLEELGLKRPFEFLGIETKQDTFGYFQFSTLDICELENARKLFGEEEAGYRVLREKARNDIYFHFKNLDGLKLINEHLLEYITLSDEGRIKYIEDYLENNK